MWAFVPFPFLVPFEAITTTNLKGIQIPTFGLIIILASIQLVKNSHLLNTLPLSTSLGMSIGLHSFEGWPYMFKVKDHEGMSPSKHILSSWGQGLKFT
jgi:hypothetical protein